MVQAYSTSVLIISVRPRSDDLHKSRLYDQKCYGILPSDWIKTRSNKNATESLRLDFHVVEMKMLLNKKSTSVR